MSWFIAVGYIAVGFIAVGYIAVGYIAVGYIRFIGKVKIEMNNKWTTNITFDTLCYF